MDTNNNIPVQTGPLYACFTCGKPAEIGRSFADGARAFLSAGYSSSPLDEWGGHIWYLQKYCKCQPERVARLGDCIAPLTPSSANGAITPADIPQIRELLARIAGAVPEELRRNDPAASLVYRLLDGRIAPENAISELREVIANGCTQVAYSGQPMAAPPIFQRRKVTHGG